MTLREHPLAWRWTDPKYALLPDEVLAAMQVIELPDAAGPFLQSPASKHTPPGFLSMTTVSTEALSKEAGCDWLRTHQPDPSEPVHIAWQHEPAIKTTWKLFTAYWDDFCYPSSDNVLVWPESEKWLLFYHHYGEFQFGNKSVV